jgi:hypothetical protein
VLSHRCQCAQPQARPLGQWLASLVGPARPQPDFYRFGPTGPEMVVRLTDTRPRAAPQPRCAGCQASVARPRHLRSPRSRLWKTDWPSTRTFASDSTPQIRGLIRPHLAGFPALRGGARHARPRTTEPVERGPSSQARHDAPQNRLSL